MEKPLTAAQWQERNIVELTSIINAPAGVTLKLSGGMKYKIIAEQQARAKRTLENLRAQL